MKERKLVRGIAEDRAEKWPSAEPENKDEDDLVEVATGVQLHGFHGD